MDSQKLCDIDLGVSYKFAQIEEEFCKIERECLKDFNSAFRMMCGSEINSIRKGRRPTVEKGGTEGGSISVI